MKCFALLAATIATIAVTLTGASAQDQCVFDDVIPYFVGTNALACTGATSWPTLGVVPTGDKLQRVCATESCTAFFQELSTALPADCRLGGRLLKAEYLEPIAAGCAAEAKPTPAPSTMRSA